ncbi:helix-turn-helix transcriptional regulator [Nonomuraea sp. MG754425]|uniref:helix-turn-helix domain-containing protein n=1 Tax=Nonomuraea sp. MG754425 TaxID=2570319 RepID=UPI001F35DC2B|nr:helix-turn-helix transcriptional regulator [Nonomuraea sp. MG754425]MCF6473585.1 helix-turn-helix transcriptional regulator [Nonomuraea sp. MG754425]
MTTSDLVGLRIKTVRRQRGLSQAQLAHPELSDSYVSLIESGKRTPTPAVLELLAGKLDCSLSYLINGVTAEQMEDIELALGYARLALENGEVAEARTRFAELLRNSNLAGLTTLRQEAEFGLALATEAAGDLDEAISIMLRLREEELPAERAIEVAVALCRAYRESARLSEAVEVAEQLLSGNARQSWTDLLVELGATLLAAYLERGDMLRARQFAAELLNAADALGTPRSIVAANWNASIVARATGHNDEAVAFAERALAVQVEHGQPRNTARMRLALARTRLRVGAQDAAGVRDMLRAAVAEFEQTSTSTFDQANLYVELACAEYMANDLDKAAEHAVTGRNLLPEFGHALGAEANLLLGRVYGAVGRVAEGREHAVAVTNWLTPLPDSRRSASAWYATAETMEQLGDTDGAVDAYRRALACAGL